MKNISAQLRAHLDGEVTTLATCMKITRQDGVQFFFTSHDRELTIDGDVYSPTLSFTRAAIQTRENLSVDNTEVEAFIDDVQLTDSDLRNGLFDDAIVEMFLINWEDVSQGKLILPVSGRLGEATVNRNNTFTAETRGLSQLLKNNIGELISPLCQVDLGSPKCKVPINPPEWTPSTVFAVDALSQGTSVVKPTAFNDRYFRVVVGGTTGLTEPAWNTTIGGQTIDGTVTWEAFDSWIKNGTVATVDGSEPRRILRAASVAGIDNKATGWFNQGILTWTSGQNSGRSIEVKTFLNDANEREFELFLAMGFPIAVSDTFSVFPGCSKRRIADCKDKFDNLINFRGFGFVPGEDERSRYPDAFPED